MTRTRKLLTTVLSLLGTTLFVACSSGAPTSQTSGDAVQSGEDTAGDTVVWQSGDFARTWIMVEMEMAGVAIGTEELAALQEDGFTVSLTLAVDGSGAFSDGETDTSLTWEKIDDSHIKLLTDDGAEIIGTVEGNQLSVDDGEETRMVLEKDS